MNNRKNPTPYLYTAVGEVQSSLFSLNIECSAYSYRKLTELMADATADIRFYTEGVNSYDGSSESYTKNLTWPEVKWRITREEHDS